MVIAIPSHWASAGYGIPAVCVKHGRPEVRRSRLRLESAIPNWQYVLLLLGVVIFFLVRVATVKKLAVTAWPFCEICMRQSQRLRWIAAGVAAVGLALFVVAVSGLPPVWALLAVVLMVVGGMALVREDWIWGRLSGAKLSDEAAWVIVAKPHSGFEAQFAPHLPAAAELWNVSGGARF